MGYSRRMRPSFKDLLPLVLAIITSIGAFFFSVHFPEEDSLILYRYSENFANSGVITYNPGDPAPVEGATDFLWMVLLAGLYALGIPIYTAAKLVSLLSLWGIGAIFFKHVPEGQNRWKFTATILFIIILQLPLLAAASGFSTYFFGFWLLLAADAFLRERFPLMTIAGFIACLIRPDGCLYVFPLIALALLKTPKSIFNRNNITTIFLCMAAGIGYFLWRWHYFGLLLPLPFYVKADIPRVFGIFNLSSVYQELVFLGIYSPVITYILYAGISKPKQKIVILAMAYIIPALFYYTTMDLFQNVYYRYHFPITIILLLFAVLLYTPKTAGKFLLCISLTLLLQSREYMILSYFNSIPSPLIGIAQDIGKLNYKGKLVTAEAGILPYYSGWNTLDIYGLDTPFVAQSQVQTGDIKRFQPDLVFIYNTSHFHDTSVPPSRYDKMISVVRTDMENQPYDVYKLTGGYYFLIARSSPAHDDLIKVMLNYGCVPSPLE